MSDLRELIIFSDGISTIFFSVFNTSCVLFNCLSDI